MWTLNPEMKEKAPLVPLSWKVLYKTMAAQPHSEDNYAREPWWLSHGKGC